MDSEILEGKEKQTQILDVGGKRTYDVISPLLSFRSLLSAARERPLIQLYSYLIWHL